MANNYRAIVADIKAILETIPAIGIVHSYERWVIAHSKFIELFKSPAGFICGWEITRRAASEHKRGPFFRHHQFVLRGYRSLKDDQATSLDFQELCDEICTAFRTAEPLALNATWQYGNGDDPDASAVQIETINERMFGETLCHCAEIQLSVTERIIQ